MIFVRTIVRLIRLGVDPEAPPLSVQHVTALNGISLLAAGFSLVTLVTLFLGGDGLLSVGYVLLSGVLPPALVLWLNARGHSVVAAVGFMVYLLASTGGAAVLFGPREGVFYYYLPIIVATFMFLPSSRRGLALVLALTYAAAFVAICVFFAEIRGVERSEAEAREVFQLHISMATFAAAIAAYYAQRVTTATRRSLQALRVQTDALLREVLPAEFVEPLREGAEVVGRRHERASVVVCDIAGFTRLAEEAAAEDIVGALNAIFSEFDVLCAARRVDKVKTIGDAYVAAVGLSRPTERPEKVAELLARDMRTVVDGMSLCREQGIRVRIGIGTGSLVAGVVGTSKLGFDVWGPAVDAAFAMEGEAEPGQIRVAGAA